MRALTFMPRYASALALDVQSGSVVWLGQGGGPPGMEAEKGLFQTTDSGLTWRQFHDRTVAEVALSPDHARDHTILISVSGYHANLGLYRSTDSGGTWQVSGTGLPGTLEAAVHQIRQAHAAL